MVIRSVKFVKNESAISTVVAAVLLLGIIVSVITVVNVQYIPEWKTAAEQEHMDDVFYGMSEMKNELDLLSAYSIASPSSSLSVSIPVKMGGASIPVFSPGKSGGRLAINDENSNLSIVGTATGPDYDRDPRLLNLGSVTYSSENSYFVNQKYVYENGALIVSQKGYSLMRLDPQIDIQRTENDTNITMYVNAIDINGPKRSISSSSVEEVNFRTNDSFILCQGWPPFTDVTMTVETSYPSSWVTFFKTMAYDAGLEEGAEYSVSSNKTAVIFVLRGDSGDDIKLDVKKSVFDARLNVLS